MSAKAEFNERIADRGARRCHARRRRDRRDGGCGRRRHRASSEDHVDENQRNRKPEQLLERTGESARGFHRRIDGHRLKRTRELEFIEGLIVGGRVIRIMIRIMSLIMSLIMTPMASQAQAAATRTRAAIGGRIAAHRRMATPRLSRRTSSRMPMMMRLLRSE